MPIYEYRCNSCQRKVSVYLRSFSASAKCPRCGSEDLARLFSTFTVRGTYKEIYDDILSDHQLTDGLIRNDPRALAEWNRRMSMGMDDQTSTPEYDEILERMEHGEMPEMPIGGMPDEDLD